MLDIFKKMVDCDIPVRLNVAGIGEEMDNLKAQAERLGIDGKVTFLGGVRDLTAYFKDVDILVNTPHCIGDHGAGVGNNILEAGLYDTPVVTYDMAGISEMVVNGETGYCIPFGDEEAFIAAVDTLVRQPLLREAMGKRLHSPQAAEQDIVYSAYPLMATNLLLGRHKARLGYKLIIDVQDVWPESFSSVIPFLKKIPHRLLPFARRADRAYRCADALVAVSQTYLDRAKEANPDVPAEAVCIGADFAAIASAPAKDFGNSTTRFFYFGTLSHSYDVDTACRGIQKLLDSGKNVELHIMGGGPDLEKLKQHENRAIKFYGYLPYADMISIAKGCDIAVNAIHSHAMQSVTNKLSDYMALQKPILNSQTNADVLGLLNLLPHENYRSGDVDSFVQAAKDILKRKNDPVQSDEIVRRFRRDISYRKIVNLIERLANE